MEQVSLNPQMSGAPDRPTQKPEGKTMEQRDYAEIIELFAKEPVNLDVLRERINNMESPEAGRAYAEACCRFLEETWKKGKFQFQVQPMASEQDAGNGQRTIYEGMPSTVFTGSFRDPADLEGGMARLHLLFRLAWKEDLISHQHKGGRIVVMRQGVGLLVAKDDQGNEIYQLLKPDTVVCMPAYTEHNFRALTATEAAMYLVWNVQEAIQDPDTAYNLSRTIERLLDKIQWDEDWRKEDEASIRGKIEQVRQEVLSSFEADETIQQMTKDDPALHAKMKNILTDLLTLELDSIHVRYSDVLDKDPKKEEASLFHEQSRYWRAEGEDRTTHHARILAMEKREAEHSEQV